MIRTTVRGIRQCHELVEVCPQAPAVPDGRVVASAA